MHNEIDDCQYIYLREFGEPKDNVLRLVIEEAKAGSLMQNTEVVPGVMVTGRRAIESDTSCQAFELVWPSYVSYSVRNESFCSLDKEEVWEGRLFCVYSKSHFLDYIARATFASKDYPGPVRHWGINCLNHIIDVVSTSEPQIRLLKPA